MRVTGFIADPKCDRGNAKLQYLFVNGRWFRDRSLAHALQESFRGLLMTGMTARYLRSEPGGRGSEVDTEALWWPPAKIAGRYLGPFLAHHLHLAQTAP